LIAVKIRSATVHAALNTVYVRQGPISVISYPSNLCWSVVLTQPLQFRSTTIVEFRSSRLSHIYHAPKRSRMQRSS
jgi:hypothetical protein